MLCFIITKKTFISERNDDKNKIISDKRFAYVAFSEQRIDSKTTLTFFLIATI